MVIFHCYVSSPEGKPIGDQESPRSTMKSEIGLGSLQSPQEYTSIPWHRPLPISAGNRLFWCPPVPEFMVYVGLDDLRSWFFGGTSWPMTRTEGPACPASCICLPRWSPWLSRQKSSCSIIFSLQIAQKIGLIIPLRRTIPRVITGGWLSGCWWIFQPKKPRLKTLHD